MDLSQWVSSIVAFVRAGYPTGMPATRCVPGAALSRRRMSSNEISCLARDLVMQHDRPITNADVGVAITRITDQLPSPEDIARVQRRVDATGCRRG
jgi:Protein of unknown function (DUF3349)